MFKHSVSSNLIDVKLDSPYKDAFIITGNQYECETFTFSGRVKLRVPLDMQVKKIKLNLIGELNMEYIERPDGLRTNAVYERLCILKVDWDNLLFETEGNVAFGSYGDTVVSFNSIEASSKKSHSRSGSYIGMDKIQDTSFNNSSTEELSLNANPNSSLAVPKRPANNKTKSSPMLMSRSPPASKTLGTHGEGGKSSKNTAHTLLIPKGDYEFPFKVVLPGNLPQSIEGLHCGHVLYRVTCTIEKGRFEKDLKFSKHIRILRTLHPRNLNMTDSIDVDATWPNKIQYKISLKRKAVAIGGNPTICLLMVPLVKGLKLKKIEGSIVQHYTVCVPGGTPTVFEKAISKQKLTIPSEDELGDDRWLVKTKYNVPSNLNDLTPSCDVKMSLFQVKHRIRISVQLKNKSGHTSEFIANLPVCVYISTKHGEVVGQHYTITPHGFFSSDFQETDSIIPRQIVPQTDESVQSDSEENFSEESETEENAPPLYQQHVFDALYDISSPRSPLEQLQAFSGMSPNCNADPVQIDSYFDIPTAKPNDAQRSSAGSQTADLVPPYSETPDILKKFELAPLYERTDPQLKSHENLRQGIASLPLSPVGRSGSKSMLSSPASNKSLFSYFHNRHARGSNSVKSGSPQDSPSESPNRSSDSLYVSKRPPLVARMSKSKTLNHV